VLLPEFIVAGELARGRLQGILQTYSPPPIAIHALYPSRRQMLAKVRLFIDFLVARFGE
jgi:DNA-binding transcriptional LysR family regulator